MTDHRGVPLRWRSDGASLDQRSPGREGYFTLKWYVLSVCLSVFKHALEVLQPDRLPVYTIHSELLAGSDFLPVSSFLHVSQEDEPLPSSRARSGRSKPLAWPHSYFLN